MSTTLDELIHSYQETVKKDPSHAPSHHHLAMYYVKCNQGDLALHHFQAAIKAAPTFIEAHFHLACFRLKQNNPLQARAHFECVVHLSPNHLAAHFYLGLLNLSDMQWDAAKDHFLHNLSQHPEHVPSLINLGVIALKQEQDQTAILYFSQALAYDITNEEARNNLAATFIHHDRYENALVHYHELLRQHPQNVEYLYNSGVAHMALEQFQKANTCFNRVLKNDPRHSDALNNLAAIEIRTGHRDKAIVFLQQALAINPTDHSSRFMLGALTNTQTPPQASQDYVRHLFNHYAFNYDTHLTRTLHYTLPAQFQDLLKPYAPHRFKNGLDLGCGTGLSGEAVRAWCDQLTGVDLSQKMLDIAQKKSIYDVLINNDMICFLQNNTESYDLIQAADVLPYHDDLSPLIEAISARLNPQGLLIMSAEIASTPTWAIQDSMRFCHHPSYVNQVLAAHQLKVLQQVSCVARQEKELPLSVMIYLSVKE